MRLPTTTAAFFDLDKTVIATSSAYVYGKEFLNSGLISPSTAFSMSLAKASYMVSGHSSEQMDASRDQLSNMVTGWDVNQVKQIADDTLHTVVAPTIYAEARDLIAHHLTAGHDVVIISSREQYQSLEELLKKQFFCLSHYTFLFYIDDDSFCNLQRDQVIFDRNDFSMNSRQQQHFIIRC